MKRVFLLVMVASVCLTPLAEAAEVEDPATGHYYVNITTSQTWGAAREAAEKLRFKGMKGHLATITSSDESEFIRTKVINALSGTHWIGAFQSEGASEPSGGWEWVTGEKWSFTKWNPGEPNDIGGEDIAEIYAPTGTWNDNKTTAVHGSLVEYERAVWVEIDSGSDGTAERSVVLELTWESDLGLTGMRFRNESDAWSDWEEIADSKSWDLSSGDGEKTVEVEFRDDSGAALSNTDGIWLDQTAPTGAIDIENGVEWVGKNILDVYLYPIDEQSGVTDVRFRNPGDEWGIWLEAASPASFTVPQGEGERTIEAQFRDAAGNVSEVLSDTVSIDQVAPTVELSLVGDVEYTSSRSITLLIEAADATSGVRDMRFRRVTLGGSFEEWIPYQPNHVWTVALGDGLKTVEVQVRDQAGNVSQAASTNVTLDESAPEFTGFQVNLGQLYVLPEEKLEFTVYARDDGSGVNGFRASFDQGTSWSEWFALVGGRQEVPKPAIEGLLDISLMLRDAAGNESGLNQQTSYLVEKSPLDLSGGGKATGVISPQADVDTVAIELVAGDILTVKLKAKATEKGKTFSPAIDLVGPGAKRLHLGRYPAVAPKVGISGYVAQQSGRHLVLVRRLTDSSAAEAAITLSVKVKQDKANKKGKGSSVGEISFDAPAGATLKAQIKGDGLTPDQVTLTGPAGDAGLPIGGKPGKLSLGGTLSAGTGTYRIQIDSPAEVDWKWGLKLPKKGKGVIEK